MSEPKWTKGPWTLGDENNSCLEVLMGEKHNLTCSFSRFDNNTGAMVIDREEMIANGHLTMAAPELFEALRMMVATGAPVGTYGDIAYAKSVAALAKALGEVSA